MGDEGWLLEDYQAPPDGNMELTIPGTYRGKPVTMNLYTINGDVRKLTLCEGLTLESLSPSKEMEENLEELYFECTVSTEECEYLFSGFKKLKILKYPRGVTDLFGYIGCTVEELYIPATVNKFSGSTSSIPVKRLYFEGTVEDWIKFDSSVERITRNIKELYIDGQLVENIVIPEGVEQLGDYLFSRIKSLKSVKLPSTLKTIGEGTFMNCESLEEIDFPENLDTIKLEAFYGCSRLDKLILPSKLTTVGVTSFNKCDGLRLVYIPKSLVNKITNHQR